MAQFCGKAQRTDFPAGEVRKGLPLGQAERVAVRPARENRAVARTHFKEEINLQNNRKRAETLTIRLTKAEKEMIKKKAKKAQLSITDFLVTTTLRTEIHVAEDIKPLLIELKKISNRINPITMSSRSRPTKTSLRRRFTLLPESLRSASDPVMRFW